MITIDCSIVEGGKAEQPWGIFAVRFATGERARPEAELTEMPNPELPGITELSAPIMDTAGEHAIAAITIPFMTAMISGTHKITMRSNLLDAAQLMQQRIMILLPQL